jgi:hypothetical protein
VAQRQRRSRDRGDVLLVLRTTLARLSVRAIFKPPWVS